MERGMKAEIIAVGTELLLGEILDTNSQYLAQQLTPLGIDLFYVTHVGDNLGTSYGPGSGTGLVSPSHFTPDDGSFRRQPDLALDIGRNRLD